MLEVRKCIPLMNRWDNRKRLREVSPSFREWFYYIMSCNLMHIQSCTLQRQTQVFCINKRSLTWNDLFSSYYLDTQHIANRLKFCFLWGKIWKIKWHWTPLEIWLFKVLWLVNSRSRYSSNKITFSQIRPGRIFNLQKINLYWYSLLYWRLWNQKGA